MDATMNKLSALTDIRDIRASEHEKFAFPNGDVACKRCVAFGPIAHGVTPVPSSSPCVSCARRDEARKRRAERAARQEPPVTMNELPAALDPMSDLNGKTMRPYLALAVGLQGSRQATNDQLVCMCTAFDSWAELDEANYTPTLRDERRELASWAADQDGQLSVGDALVACAKVELARRLQAVGRSVYTGA